jgi:ubiquinone/menaquinone biosynthesis C-methylase UbiE
MTDPSQSTYSFDPSWEGERARLACIEEWLDPYSIDAFLEHGVAEGWRCLDVAGGGGSLTRWLCDRVGPSGSVVAVDRDTRFLDKLGAPNLEVRRVDVVNDELPEAAFDLVHTRFLLQHLEQREEILRKLANALAPGGVLLVMESGGAPPQALQESEEFDRLGFAFLAAAAQTGWTFAWAPRLGQLFDELGLKDVRAHSFRDFTRGSKRGFAGLTATSILLLRERLRATGLVTDAEIDNGIAALRDPNQRFVTFENWIASGRRPRD